MCLAAWKSDGRQLIKMYRHVCLSRGSRLGGWDCRTHSGPGSGPLGYINIDPIREAAALDLLLLLLLKSANFTWCLTMTKEALVTSSRWPFNLDQGRNCVFSIHPTLRAFFSDAGHQLQHRPTCTSRKAFWTNSTRVVLNQSFDNQRAVACWTAGRDAWRWASLQVSFIC
jgi:hypothetical protein